MSGSHTLLWGYVSIGTKELGCLDATKIERFRWPEDPLA